jgi:DnaK suppressor protein
MAPERDDPVPGDPAGDDDARAEQVRDALTRRRADAEGRLAGLTGRFDEIVAASLHSNADDEHDPEGATIAFERSQVDALVLQARQDLAEVAAAEGRLAAGTWGVCERCGGRIPEGRMEARPTATTCVPCASRRPGGPR